MMAQSNTYTNIFDSHFHTQSMLEKGVDCMSIYRELFEQGFLGGIDIGCECDDLPPRREILKDFPKILLAGAMGPWEAGMSETKPPEPEFVHSQRKDMSVLESELATLRRNLTECKARFIGEIGLDYYWDYGTHDKQHLLFETQMKWANELGLAVLIHDRDADSDTIDVIRRLSPSKAGVIHCFDGCPELLEAALEHGFFISFAGNLTFRKNTDLREILKRVPLDSLLLETDAPYLTPAPHRGKLNNPSYVIHTFECAAQTLGMRLEDLSERLAQNFRNLCER